MVLLTDDLKALLSHVLLLNLLEELLLFDLLFLMLALIDVVEYWILDASERKPAIENSSAVFLVPLPKARILVQLRENLIQTWNGSLSSDWSLSGVSEQRIWVLTSLLHQV
jgi:hypothetical protein